VKKTPPLYVKCRRRLVIDSLYLCFYHRVTIVLAGNVLVTTRENCSAVLVKAQSIKPMLLYVQKKRTNFIKFVLFLVSIVLAVAFKVFCA